MLGQTHNRVPTSHDLSNSNQTKKGKYKITANLRNNKQHAGCKHQTKVNETNQQHYKQQG